MKWIRVSILLATSDLTRNYKAASGERRPGRRRCTGKNGEDIILKVPEGTVICDDESGKVIADMSGENDRMVLLKGGKRRKEI